MGEIAPGGKKRGLLPVLDMERSNLESDRRRVGGFNAPLDGDKPGWFSAIDPVGRP
ncbi:hypothetical protein D3C83_125450 [compost metagenome]